jgi:Ca2+-binding RTX toxin-like protein
MDIPTKQLDCSDLFYFGTDHDDHVIPRGRQEFILARGGNDIIHCGPMSGVYAGGEGADTFRIIGLNGNHWISDFDRMQGDKIDVSDIGITDMASLLAGATNKDEEEGCAAHVAISRGDGGRLVIQVESQTIATLQADDFIFAKSNPVQQPIAAWETGSLTLVEDVLSAAINFFNAELGQAETGPAALIGQTAATESASLDLS